MILRSAFTYSPLIESDVPRSIRSMLHLRHCGCFTGKIDFRLSGNGRDINNLTWQVGTPRNVVGTVGNEVGLSLRLSRYTSDGNDARRIKGVASTEADELVRCPSQCRSVDLLPLFSFCSPPLPSLKPELSIENAPF